MELHRGNCNFCRDSNRTLSREDSKEFCKFLPEILGDDFLTDAEFQKINKYLKVCTNCCFKIQFAHERKYSICMSKAEDEAQCRFCSTDKCLIKAESNWRHFCERTEGLVELCDFPLDVCPQCLFYFDILYNLKTNLTLQFRFLAKKKKQNTHKRRASTSLSASPKKQKMENCFTQLQPLHRNKYHVDAKLKRDKKLYKALAYVNLFDENVGVKETPKTRPIIKIKLKPSTKRLSNVKSVGCQIKSAEVENKSSIWRRHSMFLEAKQREDVGPNETPKVATDSKLVPKRRVSSYILQTHESDEAEETAIIDVDHIVQKYTQNVDLDKPNTSPLESEVTEGNEDVEKVSEVKDDDKNQEVEENEATDDRKEEATADKSEEAAEKSEEAAADESEDVTDDKNDDITDNKDGDNKSTDDENDDTTADKKEGVSDGTNETDDKTQESTDEIEEKLDDVEVACDDDVESIEVAACPSEEIDAITALVSDEPLAPVEDSAKENVIEDVEEVATTIVSDDSDIADTSAGFKIIKNNGVNGSDDEQDKSSLSGDFLNGSERKRKRVTFSV